MEEIIKLKIAASLHRLIKTDENVAISVSYNKLALATDMRKATISDTFNAKSIPTSSTLFLIVEAMGHTISDFAQVYESLTDSEIIDFKQYLAK